MGRDREPNVSRCAGQGREKSFLFDYNDRCWLCQPMPPACPYPAETVAACKASDAVLLGAGGGPKWGRHQPGSTDRCWVCWPFVRPGSVCQPAPGQDLAPLKSGPIKEEIIGDGLIFFASAELTGGIYRRPRHVEENGGGRRRYGAPHLPEIKRTVAGLSGAMKGQAADQDKANVLGQFCLWRKIRRDRRISPQVEVSYMACRQLRYAVARNPNQFDVIRHRNIWRYSVWMKRHILAPSVCWRLGFSGRGHWLVRAYPRFRHWILPVRQGTIRWQTILSGAGDAGAVPLRDGRLPGQAPLRTR